MTKPSITNLDAICEQYEAFRTSLRCGPGSIEEFLGSIEIAQESLPLLVSELAQIDIQLNWMTWDKQLEKRVKERSCQEIETEFLRIPKFSDYASLVGGAFDSQAISDMAKCEMEARNSWGDAIGPQHYAKSGIQLATDHHHHPNSLNYIVDGSIVGQNATKFVLRGKTVIGRQRSTDASDLFCEELADGNRIVIANRLEDIISREQLTIQLLSPKFALVTNPSAANSILVANRGQIEPNGSTMLKFDFTIHLPGRRMRFSKPYV